MDLKVIPIRVSLLKYNVMQEYKLIGIVLDAGVTFLCKMRNTRVYPKTADPVKFAHKKCAIELICPLQFYLCGNTVAN